MILKDLRTHESTVNKTNIEGHFYLDTYSVPKMALRNVTVLTVFGIVTLQQFRKPSVVQNVSDYGTSGIYIDMWQTNWC